MKYLLIFALFLFAPNLINAQLSETQIKQINAVYADWDNDNTPGAALGIIKNGELIFSEGYGVADLEHDIPITPQSVFYMGSVSKQFVAFSILLLEEEGRLNLDDDIHKYFPDFPDYGEKLTIRNFVHHTSGVRDYLTLFSLKGQSYLDHIEVAEVYSIIKNQKKLNFKPGDEYLYSNSCYFMLALIVEKVSGLSFPEFTHQNIFEPLGMDHSQFYNDNTKLIKNKVFSYQVYDEEIKNNILRFDLVGSGGMYSNIEDMVLWDQNFYRNKLGKGNMEILEKMHTDGLLNDGTSTKYAFAIQNGSYKGLRTVSHTGSLAGYRAMFLRFPEEGVTIVQLANRNDGNPRRAYQVADVVLEGKFPISPEGESITKKSKKTKVSTKTLDRYTGSYWDEIYKRPYKVSLKNDTLWFELSSTYKRALIPESKKSFKMTGTNNSVEFEPQKSLTIKNPNRAPERLDRFEPVEYTTEQLESYAGTYYSEELDIEYVLRMEEGDLFLYFGGIRRSGVQLVMKEVFDSEYGVIDFRGREGTGFLLHAGRVKNLKFEKE